MEKQKNIPQLRFPEFEQEWKQKNLGQVYKFKVTNSFSRADLNYEQGLIKNIHYGDIHKQFATLFNIEKESVPYINSEINTKKISEDNYCQMGDLIFADASEDYNDIGKCVEIVNLNNEKVLSGLHTILARPEKSKIAIGFAGYLMKSKNVKLQIQREAQGTKVLSISSGRLSQINITFPLLPEQQKIASFFTAIDQKISQLKRKKTLLEQYKKGVMQKIFSQEIRFRDDNGQTFPNWEKNKLGKFLIKHEEKTTENNQYPVLTSSRKGIFFQKEYFNGNDVASKDNTGYNVVPKKFFTYRHMSDDLIFRFNINTICDKGIVSTLYPVFTTKNIIDEFLEVILNEGKEFKKFAGEQKQGGSRTYVYFSKLVELIIKLPSIEEQTKIANFFSAIDDKINHTQKQIEKAEVWKKGLMQQMFC